MDSHRPANNNNKNWPQHVSKCRGSELAFAYGVGGAGRSGAGRSGAGRRQREGERSNVTHQGTSTDRALSRVLDAESYPDMSPPPCSALLRPGPRLRDGAEMTYLDLG